MEREVSSVTFFVVLMQYDFWLCVDRVSGVEEWWKKNPRFPLLQNMLKEFIEHITWKERGKRNRETGNISFDYLLSFDSMHGTVMWAWQACYLLSWGLRGTGSATWNSRRSKPRENKNKKQKQPNQQAFLPTPVPGRIRIYIKKFTSLVRGVKHWRYLTGNWHFLGCFPPLKIHHGHCSKVL